MKTRSQSITGMALTMAVASALAITITPAGAATVNYNFDYSVHDRTDLVGPAGGAGETWNQSMQGVHNTPTFWDDNVLDSAGNATGIGWTFVRTDGANVFRWNGTANISMLAAGLFYGGNNPSILKITGLDTAKTYDLYLPSYTSYAANYEGSHSTPNTTITLSPQDYLNSGDLTTWEVTDNYVVFEDMEPDPAGALTVNTVSGSAYGFWSGFQLVETAVPEPSTAVLAALGLVGVVGLMRHRRRPNL